MQTAVTKYVHKYKCMSRLWFLSRGYPESCFYYNEKSAEATSWTFIMCSYTRFCILVHPRWAGPWSGTHSHTEDAWTTSTAHPPSQHLGWGTILQTACKIKKISIPKKNMHNWRQIRQHINSKLGKGQVLFGGGGVLLTFDHDDPTHWPLHTNMYLAKWTSVKFGLASTRLLAWVNSCPFGCAWLTPLVESGRRIVVTMEMVAGSQCLSWKYIFFQWRNYKKNNT